MGDLIEIDPRKLAVSPLNERQEALGPDHDVGSLKRLEQSVQRVGVLEPPIVRERDVDAIDGYDSLDELRVTHEVIIGQRRMLAAQAVDLETIPVIVVEWDDADALEASIVENIDTFRDDVGSKDRAIAVRHLQQMNGWTQGELANHLNVSRQTVGRWLEYFDDFWKGTIIHGDDAEKEMLDIKHLDLNGEDVNKIPIEIISTIRRETGGKESGIEACALVVGQDLSAQDVRNARDIVGDNPSTRFMEALKRVAEAKHSDDTEQDASDSESTAVDDQEQEETTEDSEDSTRTREDTSNDVTNDTPETTKNASEPHDYTTEGGDDEGSDQGANGDVQNRDRITIREMTFDEQTSEKVEDIATERGCTPKQFVIEAVLDKIDNTEEQ